MPTRLLLCAALLAFAPTASALEAEVEVGLGGLVPATGWTPLKIRLRLGADDAPLTGRVVLDRPSFAVSGYAAPFSLQPGSSAVVRLCVPIGQGKSYAIRVEGPMGETLHTLEPEQDWHALESRDRLAIHLGLGGLAALGTKGKDRPRLARIAPADLPRDPRTLSEAAAVFVPGDDDDADLVDLLRSPEAVETLERYVQDGGRLVFMARPGTPPPWQGALAEGLLPTQGYTLRPVPASDFEFLLGPLPKGSVSVLEGALRPGASWKQHSGRVGLVAERSLGQGSVVLVTFDVDDPRVRNAPKIERFLASLTPARGRAPWRLKAGRLRDLAYEIFQGRSPLSTLGFALLAVAVALHLLIIGPVSSLASKRRSPWPRLLLPPALSLALGAVILVLGAASRGDPEARAMEFVVHSESGSVSQLELGLFAGADTRFSLDLPQRWKPTLQARGPLDYLTFRAAGPSLEFRDGRPVSLGPLTVPAQGFTQLRLRGPCADGPRVGVVTTPDDPEFVEVTNRSSQPLAKPFLVTIVGGATRIQALEPLAPGQSVRCDRREGLALREKQEISGDLFAPDDVEAEPLVIHRVAELLVRQHTRTPRAGGAALAAPSAWVLLIERSSAPPVTVHANENRLLPQQVRCVQIHLFSLGDS